MKRLLTCLIGFVAFTTSSCALASLLTVAPQDLIRQLVEYGLSRSSSVNLSSRSGERYAILYGRVLQPKVTAIEATFDNGKNLRGRSSNGVFALLSAGATGVCELRILGADNQILQQENLVVLKQVAQTERSTRCLLMSHQL